MTSLTRDYERCGESPGQRIRELLLGPGMWAVVSYRFRRWLHRPRALRPVRFLFNIVTAFIQVVFESITHVTLPVTVEIGPGLYLPHTGYIVVGSKARIGSHCTLTQGVTIGHGAGGRNRR